MRTLVRDALISAGVVALLLLAIEGSMRFFGVRYEASFYRLDRDLGYVPRPHAHGWSVKERESYERINSDGLRDREHDFRRAPDVIRIAVVGDSFAEAKQVDRSAAFWAVMEREMNRALEGTGLKVEVVNFGVAGYGAAQEYLTIKMRIWAYEPQVVIMSGNLHSLILHSSRAFGTVAAEGPVPYFELQDGQLALDDISSRERAAFVPQRAWDERLADWTNASRVLSLINAARRRIASDGLGLLRPAHSFAALPAAQAQAPGQAPAVPQAGAAANEDTALRGPATPELAAAWRVAEALILASRAEVVCHHAEFWFFLFDMAPQVDPDPGRRQAVARELGIPDLSSGDRLLENFARNNDILHGILAPDMLKFAEQNAVVLHGFPHHPRNTGHWNETGHALVGRLMSERLLRCSPTVRGALGEPQAMPGDCRGEDSGEARDPMNQSNGR